MPKLFVTNDEHQQHFTMQNVPGEGDCMFLAVALAATKASTDRTVASDTTLPRTSSSSSSYSYSLPLLQTEKVYYTMLNATTTNATATTMTLRNAVADVLEMPNITLFISHNRTITTRDLLQQASHELHIRPWEYLQRLRQIGGLYGGGPELTILCYLYQRPIHIYEIDNDAADDGDNNNNCNNKNNPNPGATGRNIRQGTSRTILPIVEKGVFGHGVYNHDENVMHCNNNTVGMDGDLHILVVDVSMSEKHACVLFPSDDDNDHPVASMVPITDYATHPKQS